MMLLEQLTSKSKMRVYWSLTIVPRSHMVISEECLCRQVQTEDTCCSCEACCYFPVTPEMRGP